jgi:V/A-type H+-transporting ATPase subunit E
MALTELLTTLENEAAAEAARLDAEAREEARSIVDAAEVEARAIAERRALADEDAIARDAVQRAAVARLAAAAMLREAREDGFRDLLSAVDARLAALRTSGAYRGVLRAMLRESLAAFPDATALLVDPRDEDLAAELLAELGVALPVVATLETAGGIELSDDEGRRLSNTLEERFANAEPSLRILFGAALGSSAQPTGGTATEA